MQDCANSYKLSPMRLYQRKGVWYISKGRGHAKSLRTKDKEIAQQIFRKLKKTYLEDRIIALDHSNTITLKKFRDEYINWSETVKASSSSRSDSLALRVLQDHVGDMTLKAITTKTLDDFHVAILKRGAAVSTLNTYIRRIRAAFNKAIEWEYLKKNPYHKPGRGRVEFREERKLPRFLQGDEFKKLFAAIDDAGFRQMIYFYILTGCRRSEIVRLKWQDVKDTYIVITKTKTHNDRVVPISSPLAWVISQMEKGKGYVFPRWRTPDAVTRKFHGYVTETKIPHIRLHDLRHTTASMLAMAGIPLKTIGDILGHTRASTTEIYAHLTEEHKAEAMGQLGNVFNPKGFETVRLIPLKKA